jgi:hypothetical protein
MRKCLTWVLLGALGYAWGDGFGGFGMGNGGYYGGYG